MYILDMNNTVGTGMQISNDVAVNTADNATPASIEALDRYMAFNQSLIAGQAKNLASSEQAYKGSNEKFTDWLSGND